MKLLTEKQYQRHLDAERSKFMQATAGSAAVAAVHNIICRRTIGEWRRLLDEAEESGEKYVTLAQLLVESGIGK